MKLLIGVLYLLILLLVGCSSQNMVKYQCIDGSFVDSVSSCSTTNCKTDCPQLDCASCPLKTETKIETKTITNLIYVCADLREVKNKDDCLKVDSGGWYEVKIFSGSSPKTTEPFKINSKRWRYSMNCSGTNEYSMYNIEVNKLIEDQSSQVDFKMMAKCETKGDPSYVYDGPGEYFFDFTPANINSWTIKVEATK